MVETLEAAEMILIAGGDGQLGKSINTTARALSHSSSALGREDLDITNKSLVNEVVKSLKPNIIINCAAWTNVEEAENYPDRAIEINAYGALNLAIAAKSVNARFFQLSTDYVFSGEKNDPWNENDKKSPISSYGLSKSMGEDFVLEAYPENAFIIRTAWLYGLGGNNFLTKVLQKIESNESNLRIVEDQYGQPTLVTDLAERVISMCTLDLKSRIFHATNTGHTSWFEFASKIYNLRGQSSSHIVPIKSAEFISNAKRPGFSVLGQSAWANSNLTPMRNWQDALTELLAEPLSQGGGVANEN
jgi:dTDP-4-dehydrorhamnose reductase